MSSPEIANLTRELLGMQRQLRDLATGNPLNSAAIETADGKVIALGELAFGQVTAVKAVPQATRIVGNLTTTSSPGPWVRTDGPQVDVLVRGGRLRVDWAGLVAVEGRTSIFLFGYEVLYLGPLDNPNSETTVVVPPDWFRSTLMQSEPNDGSGRAIGIGNFFLHDDLDPGWYRVRLCYRLDWQGPAPGGSTIVPAGHVDHPRLAVTPL